MPGAPVTTAGAKKWPGVPRVAADEHLRSGGDGADTCAARLLALGGGLTIGPTSVAGSIGSPTRSDRVCSTNASTNGS